MPIFHGRQSQYLIDETNRNKREVIYWTIFLTIVGIILISISFIPTVRYSLWGPLLVLPAALLIYLPFRSRINNYIDRFWNFVQGKTGEGAVWYKLHDLSDEWHVLQDLHVSPHGGNVDFALVGPTGVFALEVKSERGKIGFENGRLTVYGKPFQKDFIAQAKGEAFAIHNEIKDLIPFVEPVVVFSSWRARMHFGLKPQNGAYVIGKKWLKKVVEQKPPILSADQVSQIVDRLKRYCPAERHT